jgi:hypothetical protein
MFLEKLIEELFWGFLYLFIEIFVLIPLAVVVVVAIAKRMFKRFPSIRKALESLLVEGNVEYTEDIPLIEGNDEPVEEMGFMTEQDRHFFGIADPNEDVDDTEEDVVYYNEEEDMYYDFPIEGND